jgi:hypothetical protein
MPTDEEILAEVKADLNAIPTTLDEAFAVLDSKLSDEDRRYLQESESPDKAAVSLHHSLGRAIRNEWGLWGDSSKLKQLIAKEHGITHPDDVSGFILREYARARIPTAWQRLMED